MKNPSLNPLRMGTRPASQGIPNPTCPILLEAHIVLDKTKDLHRAIRRLRRSTQRCLTCPERRECPTMNYFAQEIDSAIHELRREWGLDHD